MRQKFIIGIDEAGRGPLAGPVAVGVACASPQFFKKLGRLKDSKQLTAAGREEWYTRMCAWRDKGILLFGVAYTSAAMIDKKGIVPGIRDAMSRALERLSIDPVHCLVLLDGGLKAPTEYLKQQTIIRGDALEPAIALASIAAKVERDRLVVRLAKKYPNYGIEQHKGYGTKKHREAIRLLGPSVIHRRSFLRGLL